MPRVKDVMTGEVAVGGAGDVLRSSAIGSCIVVAAYSPRNKVGGLAHVMLPGRALVEDHPQRLRYAGNSIDELWHQLALFAGNADDIVVCLAGGANVLQRTGDTTGSHNVDSVLAILQERGAQVLARSLGGVVRRALIFDIDKARVCITIGDGGEQLLWSFL